MASRPKTESRPGEIRQLINAIRALKGFHQRHSRRLMKTYQITGPQLGALRIAAHSNPISVGRLSERMYLHASTVSGIVDRLEKRGLLFRAGDPHDRRVVHLKVTPKGMRIIKAVPVSGLGLLVQEVDRLKSADLRRINEAMKLLLKIMKIEPDRGDDGESESGEPGQE